MRRHPCPRSTRRCATLVGFSTESAGHVQPPRRGGVGECVRVCAFARLRLHEQTGEFPQNALWTTEGKSGSFLMIEAPDDHEEEARVVGVALCCVAMGATPSTQRVEIATHSRLPSVWLKGSAKQSPHF